MPVFDESVFNDNVPDFNIQVYFWNRCMVFKTYPELMVCLCFLVIIPPK